ncbi:MAG: hypothetical protein HY088_05955 [Ignavibacteriales bacterium]|nr:hypothetical protein [Ignavibacteriales bacterium]
MDSTKMLEALNQYSDLIIAIAALSSAFFAFAIWKETKKYRQVTEKLVKLNEKMVEKDEPKVRIDSPGEIKAYSQGLGIVKFKIPIWLVNLSNKPNSVLSFEMKVDKQALKFCYLEKKQNPSDLPLEESIHLNSWSSSTVSIERHIPDPLQGKIYPTVLIEVLYTYIGGKFTNVSIKYQLKKTDSGFYLIKVNNID